MSIFSDLVLATMLIGLLIPGWIICAGRWGNKMLGAYAAVPMMIALYRLPSSDSGPETSLIAVLVAFTRTSSFVQ